MTNTLQPFIIISMNELKKSHSIQRGYENQPIIIDHGDDITGTLLGCLVYSVSMEDNKYFLENSKNPEKYLSKFFGLPKDLFTLAENIFLNLGDAYHAEDFALEFVKSFGQAKKDILKKLKNIEDIKFDPYSPLEIEYRDWREKEARYAYLAKRLLELMN